MQYLTHQTTQQTHLVLNAQAMACKEKFCSRVIMLINQDDAVCFWRALVLAQWWLADGSLWAGLVSVQGARPQQHCK